MPTAPETAHTIETDDGRLLLVTTTRGTAVHAATEAAPPGASTSETTDRTPDGEPVDVESTSEGHTGAASHRAWSPRALCGITWTRPAAPADRTTRVEGPPARPTCRRCVAALDRMGPTSDDPLNRAAASVVHAVGRSGSVEVAGVPPEQVRPLRAVVRRKLRRRFGDAGTAWWENDMLVVALGEPTGDMRRARSTEAIRAMTAHTPMPARNDPDWRLSWGQFA